MSDQPGTIGTRSPSRRLPVDTALRQLRESLTECVDAGASLGTLVEAVLLAHKGPDTRGNGAARRHLESQVLVALVEAELSPLEPMIGFGGDDVESTIEHLCVTRTRDEYGILRLVTVDLA